MSRQKLIALHEAIFYKLKSKQVGDLIKQAIKAAERRPSGERWNQKLLAQAIGTSEDILSRSLLGKIHIDPITISQIAVVLNVGIVFSVEGGTLTFNTDKNVSEIISAESEITDAKKVEEKHTRGKKRN